MRSVRFASAFRTAGVPLAHLKLPFSGTGTLACAPLLSRNPSDLGFRKLSHSMNQEDGLQPVPLKPKFKNAGQRPAVHKPTRSFASSLRTHVATVNLPPQASPTLPKTKCSPSPKLNPCAPRTRSSTKR